MKYFIKNATGNEYGPFDATQLAALARSGRLVPNDHVRQDGKSKWHTANSIQGLFASTPDTDTVQISDNSNAPAFPVLQTEPVGLPVTRSMHDKFSRMKWRDSSRFWSIVFSRMLAVYGYAGLILQVWCWWVVIRALLPANNGNPQRAAARAIQQAGKDFQLNSFQVIDATIVVGYFILLAAFPILISVGLLWWSEVIKEQIRVTETRRRGITLPV